MNFDWTEINEIKAVKKAKITMVTHTDIDRWLKSVDGFARDLQDLKKAKEKSQSKLDQIKKKYEPVENQKKELKASALAPKEKESLDDRKELDRKELDRKELIQSIARERASRSGNRGKQKISKNDIE